MSHTTPVKKQGIFFIDFVVTVRRDKDAEREFGFSRKRVKRAFPTSTCLNTVFWSFPAPNIHMGLNSLLSQGC